MDIDTIRKLENDAANVEVALSKRSFAAGILLVTYSGLRFAGVQRMRSFETTEESIRGTRFTSKAKKQRGQHWPRARPMMGITKCTNWTQPLLGLRQAYEKVNGGPTQYTFPRIDYTRGV